MVSDRPHANRTLLSNSAPVPPPLCTFSGEFLRAGRPYESPKVGGNAFACLAQSTGAVKEMMESSEYNDLKIWDLSTAVISPLLTVHSSTLDARASPSQDVPASPAGQSERLVVLPDMPNVLDRRVSIRPRHSPNFARLHQEGYVSWAGPMFEEHVDADISKRPFKGSVMVVNESNWGGFMSKVQSDIYVKEKIWDMEKASFIPFRTLMRRLQ